MKSFYGCLALAAALSVSALAAPATAQITAPPSTQQGGEAIYKGICQSCHMPDARGAIGAGQYPALAHNQKLEAAGYPLAVVIHGQKAMPAFGGMLSDQQVADVVNYIRSNFGNHYADPASEADAKASR